MSTIVPAPKQFLWCDEHAKIATWLTNNKLGLEFYGAFVNYCARSMDQWQRPGSNPLRMRRQVGHLHNTLSTRPLSGAAVLGEIKFFYKRFFKTGDFSTGAFPLIKLLDEPERINSAHRHLYNKVFNRHVLAGVSTSTSTTLPTINTDTLAVVNGASAAPTGLQDQRPLPDGPLHSTLPIREQALAVASLETSLPDLSAPATAAPEQQAREHGSLLLLGGQEQQGSAEIQDEDDEDGGVKL